MRDKIKKILREKIKGSVMSNDDFLTFEEYINEEMSKDLIISSIKEFLLSEDEFDRNNWEEFINDQEIGQCQLIVASIIREFGDRGVKKVFGEIEVDEPFTDDYEEYDEEFDEGEPNYKFTHHWVEINNTPYDFSKGTLKDFIYWDNLYEVSTEGEKWRYNEIKIK